MIELLIPAAMVGVGTVVSAMTAHDTRPNRFLYGAMMGWWKGAFTPENAASTIANMIDCDYSCELWRRHGDTLESSAMQARVTYSNWYRCELTLKDKEGKRIEFKATAWDDYLLASAYKRWRKRAARLKEAKKQSETQRLIDARVSDGYIKTVEMVEKRILGREESETAEELRALMPPEPPVPNPLIQTVKSKKARNQYAPLHTSTGTTNTINIKLVR